jgi:DNA-binding response OmpR family regulator
MATIRTRPALVSVLALEAGMAAYLMKPIDTEELVNVTEKPTHQRSLL